MARSHHAMKASRALARRQLASLRTTRIDARHDQVTDELIEDHFKHFAQEDDE